VVWGPSHWQQIQGAVCERVWRARSEAEAWHAIVQRAKAVMRAFSSSFYLVTRFLPPRQRAEVEVIYASVRYPDEIVDTFPLSAAEKLARLEAWQAAYREAMRLRGIRERIHNGLPWILAGFAEVAREGNPGKTLSVFSCGHAPGCATGALCIP